MTDSSSPFVEATFRILPDVVGTLRLRLDTGQLDCMARFCSLLVEHNKRVNLTAVVDPEAVLRRHVVDSLALALAVPTVVLDAPQAVVDVGTGGGVPGLILAIALPLWRLTLVDSVAKKARFASSAPSALGLRNVRVICDRVEAVGRSRLRDSFDLAVARAVTAAPTLVEYCAPLVRPGGLMALYRGRQVESEMTSAANAISSLGCRMLSITQIPDSLGTGDNHAIALVEKLEATPARFPRRVGVARARPL